MKSAIVVLLLTATANAIYDPRCYLPKDPGPCRGFKVRYAFDPSERRCEQFVYGGCQGNENNFMTERECILACMTKRISIGPVTRPSSNFLIRIPSGKASDSTRCTQSIDSGLCYGYMPKYAFDASSGKCVPFIYGGCGGNSNRFETKKECQLACLANTPMPI